MLTRGIIDSIIDKTTVRVRIPLLNNADFVSGHTLAEDLPIAKFCTLPRCDLNVKIGDVVIVGFETNDFTKPIILGYLYGAAENANPVTLIARSLYVENVTNLPENTSVGMITKSELNNLTNSESNLQDQLNKAYTLIANLQDRLETLEHKLAAIYS